MRIPSGKTDQVIYFVAVDATDLKTRKTGLSSFTVYRSRNGGAATAYTTPTVAELSAATMPGVYSLLIDEDTTIAAGSDSEEYCVHITQASMAPVTRTVELYRRDTTTGNTLSVSAAGAVSALAAGAITASVIATDAIDADALAADAVTEIQAGLSTLNAAGVRSAVGLASANLDTQLTAIDDYLDTEVAAIKAKTDQLTFGVANTLNANVTYVNEIAVNGAGTEGDPWGP